jgi:hypothetical protein
VNHVAHPVVQPVHVAQPILVLRELRVLVQLVHLSQHRLQPVASLLHILPHPLARLACLPLRHPLIHVADLGHHPVHPRRGLLLHAAACA